MVRLSSIRTAWRCAATVAVAVAAATCGDDRLPTEVQPIEAALAPATKLAFSVQPSNAVAGAPIKPAVKVAVRDAYGRVVTTATNSVTVALASGAGTPGAHLRGTLTVAAVGGVATFPNLSVDLAGTGYRLAATATGLSSATSGTFRVVTAPASRLSFTVQPSGATAGAAIAPAVKVAVRDSVGNVVTTATAVITVALSSGTGTAGAHLKGTLSVTAIKGVGTFSTLSVDSAGTGYTLGASATGLAATTSTTFDVAPAPATTLSFRVQPTAATAGAPIAPAVSVAVLDRLGNAVKASTAGITVGLAGGAGTAGAHLRGTLAVNADSGVATFPTLSVDSVGTGYKLAASASGLTGATSAAFAVAAAPATVLAFAVQPFSIAPGEAISPPVKVAVRDSLGNVVTTSTASISLALSGGPAGAELLGTTTVGAVAGVATFSTLTVDSLGTGYTLAASATDLAGAASTAFDVATAPPVKLSFGVQPSTATAGAPIAPAVTVAVLDRLGNPATTSTASITVALSAGTAGAHLRGTATASAENGVATFPSLSVDSVGTGYVLTAGASGLAGATSGTFDVAAAPAAMLGFTVQPANTTAGEVIAPPVSVAVRDSVGNLVTASADYVTVTLGGSGPAGAQLGGTTGVGAVGGVATFPTLTVDSAGTGYTLTAAAPGLASATSNAFVVDSTQRSYTTSFPLTEYPISEGGRWVGGGSVGLDWTDVSTTPGLAVGHEVNGNASDATAILTGKWAPDQYAEATVYWNPDGREPVPEVELRLRSAIAAHVNRGYEITFGGGYLIIVRWNGPFQNYTYLFNKDGSQYTPKTGDVIRATIVGNTISAYKNGVLMTQVTDATWTDGAPGMGFNSGTHGGTYDNTYGFTSFTAGRM
jgi:protein-disulfide isomerase-like protein with CxxC motif